MASLTRSQLKTSSNTTYDTNGVGGITAAEVRTFNDDLIDSLITNDLTGAMSVATASLALTASSVSNGVLSSLNSFTASATIRLNNLETTSASVNVSISNLNAATSSYAISASVAAVDAAQQQQINSLIAASSSYANSASFAASQLVQDGRLNNLESTSASVNVSVSNLNTFSASALVSINALNTNSASVNTSISNLNSATQSLQGQLTTIGGQSGSWITESETGSFAITGSNTFRGQQIISASLIVLGDNATDVQIFRNAQIGSSGFTIKSTSIEAYTPQIEIKGTTDATLKLTPSGTGNSNINFDTAGGTNHDIMGITGVTTNNSASLQIKQANQGLIIAEYGPLKQTRFYNKVDVSGSVDITGSLSASLNQGYVWVGDANNRTVLVSTSSFGTNLDTSSFATTASFNAYTASTNSRLNNIESTTASLLIETANLESFSASALISINSLNGKTGSYATTGSNQFNGNQVITGSVTSSLDMRISGVKFGVGSPSGTASIAIGINNPLGINTGNNNIAIGAAALDVNTTGGGNVAISLDALGANTTGNNNVAIGAAALRDNQTGIDNVAIGTNAGFNAGNVNYNIIIGRSAATAIKGDYNTIVGRSAAINISSGSNNTLIGQNVAANIKSGSYNTIVGDAAGINVSGSYNTLIGTAQGVGNWSNVIAISDGQQNIRALFSGSEWDLTGSLDVSGSFTASLQQGHLYVGNANGRTTTIATSSLVVNVDTGSLVTTSSFNSYTASTNQRLTSIESVSGSWITESETGSFVTSAITASTLITASFNNGTRNLTFTKGDNTTFNVNIPDVSGSSGDFVTTASFNAYTASNDQRVSSLESNSASVNVSISNLNAATASYVTETESGSFLITASFDNGTRNLTFTKGNATQFSVNIPDVSGSASINTGSFFVSASNSNNSNVITFFQGDGNAFGITIDTGSLASLNQATASLQTFTQSAETSITNLNASSASQQVSINNLNSATQSLFVSASLAITTASVNNDDITFTKGDGTQFTIQVATGSFALSASYAETASLAINAKDIVVDVKNTTGAQINKGTVVRIIGATGDNPLIGTASWEDDDNSANTLGFVVADIPNDSFGRVMTQGTLLSVDTNPSLGYTAGQIVYLSGSGQYTNVKPPAPYHEVRLGQVLRTQQNNGSIYVLIQNGYELTELHDVDINTGSLANNDLLAWNSASQQWVNKTVTAVGALTTASFNSLTGSFATTGSNTFIGTQIISGSVTMAVTGSGDIDTLRLIPWISSSTYNGGRDTTIIARDRQQTGANASTASFQPAVASPINIVFGAIGNNSVQATISGSNNVIPAVRTSAAGLCDFSANRSWIGIMPATRNPRYGAVRIDNSLLAATVTAVNNTAGLSASLAQGYEGFGFGDAISLSSTTVNANITLNPNSSSVLIQNSAINGTTTINGNKSDFWSVAAYAAGSGSYTLIGNLTISGITTITDQSSVSASLGGGGFNRGIVGGNVVLTNPIGATSNNYLQNFIVVGNSLTVTGSEANSNTGGGSAFFGRNNKADGIANNTANTIFAVGTGTGQTAATRKTGFLIDTGSNAYFEGSLNVSGATSLNGNLIITGSLTASLQEGYVLVGNASGITTTVATSSFATTINTGSFATTGSNSFFGNQTITGSLLVSGAFSTSEDITLLDNMKIGRGGGNQPSNIRFGVQALASNTTAYSQVAIGNSAMHYTSGSGAYGNVAIGNQALQYNQGSQNVALGEDAMRNNGTGTQNLAIGANALNSNTSGTQNVAIGLGALYNNDSGSRNIAIGPDAGLNLKNGEKNILIGYNTGNTLTGSNNVVIGGYTGESKTLNNNIILADGSGNVKAQFSGSAWELKANTVVSGSLAASTDFKLGRGTDKPTNKVTVGSGGLIVSNSLVTSDSYIFATADTTVGNYSPVVSNITAGSFSLSNGGYGGNISVMYMIVNPY